MISVQQLSKTYPGGVTAVREVSFSVDRGEVVGFLGPNGAGKSTTMRILSGFISPSGGRVEVNGLDVSRRSLEVRQQLGYLPEHCPLYPEMRVAEYLRFRADLKGVTRRHRSARVDRVLEQCGLGDVRRRLIGHLSKGYRQRVGIAEALIGSPDLLILDEPTIGLDPNQILQIRELIRELADDHTVLISSHILSEIEATCDRVIVMCRGRVVESCSLNQVAERWFSGTYIDCEVKAGEEECREALAGVDGLESIQVEVEDGWSRLELRFPTSADPREELFEIARDKKWALRELHLRPHSLEEAFINMTRENGAPGQEAS